MRKQVHVHIHRGAATRDGGEGRWVTIHGTHVFVGKGGRIEKGPSVLVGKSEKEATAHGPTTEHGNWQHHAERVRQNLLQVGAKGEEHPSSPHHEKASNHHHEAVMALRMVEAVDDEGAKKHHLDKAHEHAARALEHERAADEASGKKHVTTVAPKPKAHQKLHDDAAAAVRGSKQHEDEHGRLQKMYDESKSDWERNAVNRKMEHNVVAKTMQSHNDAASRHEEKARALSSLGDRRGAAEHEKAAGMHEEAMKAHREGSKAAASYSDAAHDRTALLFGTSPAKATPGATAEPHMDAAATFRARAQSYRKPAGELAKPDENMAQLHEELARHHEAIAKNPDGAHVARRKAIAELHAAIAKNQGGGAGPKTTAQHRSEAWDHGRAGRHEDAAKSYEAALAAYPEGQRKGAMYEADRAKLEGLVKTHRTLARGPK